MSCFLTGLLTSMLALCACGSSKSNQNESESQHSVRYEDIYDVRKCDIVYTQQDSVQVVDYLKSYYTEPVELFFAKKFFGIPYIAHTLEGNEPEKLVVNLRQLDCTTLVETVLALSITKYEGGTTFAQYADNLERVRYRGGRMTDYTSRLHYFDWWINDNIKRGIIKEATDPLYCTEKFRVDNHYMTQHSNAYVHLKGKPERIDSIRKLERAGNGHVFTYLPKSKTQLGRREIGFIHDGDIVAIVTSKDGLDYAHLGFAVWGDDGKLHLLNASSIHKKVVLEPKTLFRYLNEHPSFLGIRVFRLNKERN